MRIGRSIFLLARCLYRRFCERISYFKQGWGSAAISCILKDGHVEEHAKIFSSFPNTVHIGAKVKIGRGSIISNFERPGQIEIGDDVSIGWNNTFYCQGGVKIGKGALFASNVCILTSNHGFADLCSPIKNQQSSYAPVVIGDDTWIGYNVVILPGVHIGKHVVIGAGSIVTRDMPDNSVCAGNPCRVIRVLSGKM